MSQELNVIQRTQQIIVEPVSGTVSIVNAGPMGPAGPIGPPGPAAGGGPLVVMSVRKTDVQSGISAQTDLTGLAVAYQNYINHRYEIMGYLPDVQQIAATGSITLQLVDTANAIRATALMRGQNAGQGGPIALYYWYDATSTAAQNMKLRIQTTAGTTTVTCTGSSPGSLTVRDTGVPAAGT